MVLISQVAAVKNIQKHSDNANRIMVYYLYIQSFIGINISIQGGDVIIHTVII